MFVFVFESEYNAFNPNVISSKTSFMYLLDITMSLKVKNKIFQIFKIMWLNSDVVFVYLPSENQTVPNKEMQTNTFQRLKYMEFDILFHYIMYRFWLLVKENKRLKNELLVFQFQFQSHGPRQQSLYWSIKTSSNILSQAVSASISHGRYNWDLGSGCSTAGLEIELFCRYEKIQDIFFYI